MGSEFHSFTEVYDPRAGHIPFLPFSGDLFVSGRTALSALIDELGTEARYWLPEYICPDVKDVVSGRVAISWYRDFPDEPEPDFDSLNALPGDVVVVQDTFGLGNGQDWRLWSVNNPGVLMLEDITHHCSQERYLQSPANFVFASLRKSLPVADGGIVFRNDGHLRHVGNPGGAGGRLKLEAMVLKSAYLSGLPVTKAIFRDLQIRGEAELVIAGGETCLPHTKEMLNALPLGDMRARWERNNRRLKLQLGDLLDEGKISVLRGRSASEPQFHAVLDCVKREARDRLMEHLIENNVYPAVHWNMTSDGIGVSDQSKLLSGRLLTVPTDFRYDDADIDYMCDLIVEGVY